MAVVLVVDDEPALREMIGAALTGAGFQILEAADVGSAERILLGPQPIDVVLTDVRMPGDSGIELAERSRTQRPDIPVLVMTAFGDVDTAVSAVRSGAYDFIAKPFDLRDLLQRVERAAKHRALKAELASLRENRAGGLAFESMVGESPPMQAVFAMIERVAASDTSVVILGESGTGKELVARALHAESARRPGPFVAINCAAMTETLLETELFGHAKGAFTDAKTARAGLMVRASGGTLFLDEVAELSPALQAKLLRALQERVVRPVGSDRDVPFDARIVSATHADLEQRVAQKTFREDLFYRLDVVEIRLPPLRARGSDVLLLAEDFLRRAAEKQGRPVMEIDPAAAKCLLDYAWPGNVRELANVIERGVALARSALLTVADLPDKVVRPDRSHVLAGGLDPTELGTLDEMEHRYIQHVLRACGGHRGRAAEILGIDRKTLYSKLKEQ